MTAANNRQQAPSPKPFEHRNCPRAGLWTGQARIACRRLVPAARVNRRSVRLRGTLTSLGEARRRG